MPELPEVETSLRGIEPYLVGATIVNVVVRNPRLRWPIPEEIHALCQQSVLSVQRRAKYLLLALPAGWITIHLGMSGCLRVMRHGTAAGKHDHVDLVMNNGWLMRYTDPRRFGCWLWHQDLESNSLLTHLGPEPLSEDFNNDYLFSQSRAKRTALKPWLMDNKLVVGIGNIYASESLFASAILPHRPAMSLTQAESGLLVTSIKTVLQRSIAQGGTTLRDFLHTEGKPGYFAQELQVYGRKGEACRVCGNWVDSIKQGQRRTFFCAICQK